MQQKVPVVKEDKEHEFKIKTARLFGMLAPTPKESIKLMRAWLKVIDTSDDYDTTRHVAQFIAMGGSQLEARRHVNFILEILDQPRAVPDVPQANSRANVRLLRSA